MSQARLKRIAALEKRQPTGKPFVDPFPAAMRLWVDLQAVVAGKACWVPRPARELDESAQDALARAMAAVDLVAERFAEQRKAAEEARRAAKAERRAARRAARAVEAAPAPRTRAAKRKRAHSRR
jgi:hypothetical protein